MLNLHFHAKGDSRTALMQRLLPHLSIGGSIICIYHLRTMYVQSFNNGFYKEMKDMPYSTYYQIVPKTSMINEQMQSSRQHRRTLALTWKHFIENVFVENSACEQTQISSTPSPETTAARSIGRLVSEYC
ncbi:hypothetical protein DPMN_128494 [Dreissena polymorpha]|uniref:Uncharacterized protein n=1 Tax=Dreissena polymorpha TaxID=45954 RepID=A0A9D4H0Y0_DREPO|nr:hypothetical protein DPMN_128494 [Dreissena polymorpha]